MSEGNQLAEIIKAHYQRLHEAGIEAVSPRMLAQASYSDIDPETVSPIMVQYAAQMHLREMARSFCRRDAKDLDAIPETQTSLWPQLQPRYPADRNGEECYVLREKLTYEERVANINRLRSEAKTKNSHADALQAETDSLVKLGVLAFATA